MTAIAPQGRVHRPRVLSEDEDHASRSPIPQAYNLVTRRGGDDLLRRRKSDAQHVVLVPAENLETLTAIDLPNTGGIVFGTGD